MITSIDYQMNKKSNAVLYILLIFSLSAIGQTKSEKEERIDRDEFPESAAETVNILPNNVKRLKFYKETDGNRQSYECKFKLNRKRYSVEYSQEGIIEDIEITIKFNRIADSIISNIESYLNDSFDKYRIIKVQEQFLYTDKISPTEFLDSILQQTSKFKPNFEIIAEVKSNKKRTIRELTFSPKGEFVNSRILTTSSYEHVLY